MSEDYKSARDFFVARLTAEAPNHNTLIGRRVTLYFQTAPGIPSSSGSKWGIKGLDYKVFWGAQEKQTGQTSSNQSGKVVVVVCSNPSTKTILEILGTRYEIIRLKNFAPTKTVRGIQQRLTILGYYCGELIANENAIVENKDLYNIPNVETEQAILDFQADNDLFTDALFGPKSIKAIDKILVNHQKEKVIAVATGTDSDYEARKATLAPHSKLKKLVHKYLQIFPVRFTRAPHATDATRDSGGPDANAPDPDDRGFLKCLHTGFGAAILPVGFDEDLATQAETRIRLIRFNIDNNADLFVTSSTKTKLEITSPSQVPVGGTKTNKLPTTEKAIIKFRALETGVCFIEIRYGSQDGPIIHRLQIKINSLITLDIKAHVPIINSSLALNIPAVPAQSVHNTKALIEAKFEDVNKIYFPYGIKFDIMNTVDTDVHNFQVRGSMDFSAGDATTLANNNREGQGVINVIFVQQIVLGFNNVTNTWTIPPNRIGGAASSAINNPNGFTVYLADWAGEAQTIAHEIGHIFGLRHFFAQVNESAWPAEVFGEHEKFSIMNYGANSVMTSDDKDDLRRLYQMAWAGQLTHINGTPIQLVKPFHTITQT